MNDNEKLVWAATFAKYWTGEKSQTPTAVEMAWAAIEDLRSVNQFVKDGWGDDHEVYIFLQEMISPEKSE